MANSKNQIKGLTVKIGGDTSDLSKALEDISKKTKPITAELSSVNRLLKFNPDNAELLAQKQTLLSKAISETEDKLKLLKDAEAQVQEQFERGEASEEQFRALRREIVATEGKLEGYKKEVQNTAEVQDKLGKASDEAADDIDDAGDAANDTAKDVKELKDAAKEADESTSKLGENLKSGLKTGFKAAAAGATALIAALGATAESTRELRTGFAKLDTAFETNGFSAKQGRELYNDLYAVLGDSDRVIETEGNLSKLCSTQEDLNKWVDISTGIYAQFGDGLPIEGLAEAANETAKVAKITGPLADAINWSTTSTEEWNKALAGNDKALAKFQAATQEGMSAEDAFNEALLACNSEQERQSLITDTLTYLYKDQAAAYKETASSILDANRAQAAMEQSLASIGGAVEPVMSSFKMLGAEFLDELIPSIEQLSGGFTDLMDGVDGADRTIAQGISGILTSIIEQVTDILPTVVSVASELLSVLVGSIVGMTPQLVSTVLEIANTLLGELDSIALKIVSAVTNAIPQIITAIIDALPQLLSTILQVGVEILNTLPEITAQLIASIPLLIDSITSFLVSGVPQIVAAAIQLFNAILDALPVIIEELIVQLPTIIMATIDCLLSLQGTLFEAGVQLLRAIVDAIPVLIELLITQLPLIIDTIVSFFANNMEQIFQMGIDLLVKLATGIITAIPQLVNQLPRIIISIVRFIIETLPQISATGFQLLLSLASGIVSAIPQLVAQLPKIISSITSKLRDGLSAMRSIGRYLVEGLWEGISSSLTWIRNKISGWVGNVLEFIKNLFGINSPATTTKWMGKMLDYGFGMGIEENADVPLSAMENLSDDLLDTAGRINGATIERQLNATFSGSAATKTLDFETLVERLDRYLPEIISLTDRPMVLDDGTLVGRTIGKVNAGLASVYELEKRGVK